MRVVLAMNKFRIIHRFPDITEVQEKLSEIKWDYNQFEIVKDESERFYGVDGSLSTDVLIYFEKHWEEILLYPGVYDILKASLVLLWLKVSKRFKLAKNHNINGNHEIEISFKKDENGEIMFNLKGDLDSNLIESITESMLRIASNNQQAKELLTNPDFLESKNKKPRVRLRYNKETNAWKPVKIKQIDENFFDEQ